MHYWTPLTLISAFTVFILLMRLTSALKGTLPRRLSLAGHSRIFSTRPPKVNKYSNSIFLPTTTFELRANASVKDLEIQQFWDREKIFETICQKNTGKKFILHDGPPFANGNLHVGHALNKILKDIIVRYQLLRGRKVDYIPGWDCHGLPIEHKVIQSLSTKQRQELTPVTLRKKAAVFAKEAIDAQLRGFKRFGVWGNWVNPYYTMSPEYEAAQIRVFGEMVSKGFIYRGLKPVHWSPSSQSALAEAELEYPENHVSTSVYAAFDVEVASEHLKRAFPRGQLRLAIWTTTPWTLPANMAVAVNPNIHYCVVTLSSSPGTGFIVADDLANRFAEVSGAPEGAIITKSEVFTGAELEGTTYRHPIASRSCPVVCGGEYINTASGTGLVHTAPGHGHEDYLTGMKCNLNPFSPVDDRGRFTVDAGADLVGLDVLGDGNKAVIEKLRANGSIVAVQPYPHKYPYDWRTKKPTIVRATEQWFANIDLFRQDVSEAINAVRWFPDIGKARISAMTESRTEWCISRQRSWGVPIPVFYQKHTGSALMTKETIDHVASIFEKLGSNAWFELPEVDLLPPGPLRDNAMNYVKGTDTMDVWFDSGTSWSVVLLGRDKSSYPADVYLEGSDQHRGWFQSSLLTSVAVNNIAPYKAVVTHGFVLDEKGYKMSKSLGNVVDPMTVIEGGSDKKKQPAYGADTLRLWVSSVDYSGDVCIGDNLIKSVSDAYRKLRNTLRFLIGSLSDFNPAVDTIPYDLMPSLDKYILGRLTQVVNECEAGYDQYQFFRIFQSLVPFATVDLSAFYLDTAKDRLYISERSHIRRKSCQTVLYTILQQFSRVVAPVAPHLAEDLWKNWPHHTKEKSIFAEGWILDGQRFPPHEVAKWQRILTLRNDINRCIEKARQDKRVGASPDCEVAIHCSDPEFQKVLSAMQGDSSLQSTPHYSHMVDDLRFVMLVSKIDIMTSPEDVFSRCPTYFLSSTDTESKISVGIAPSAAPKCERCWFHSDSVGSDKEHFDVCLRCGTVLDSQK